jgi:hypothetical protein
MPISDQVILDEAIRDVQTRKFASIRAAARHYDLCHSTLQRRLHGGVLNHQKAKEQSLLSKEQERLVKASILEAEAHGHPMTSLFVRELAEQISTRSSGLTIVRTVRRFAGAAHSSRRKPLTRRKK